MTDFASLSDADLLAQYKAAKGTSNPSDFAQAYGPAAAKAAEKLGVDPQVLLGQWGLETGWGKSIIPGTNNLGNIKDFAGGGVAATDNMTGSRDKYRAYDSPEAFADDYVSLIQRKYPSAVGAKTPEQFAAALKSGGYAEDPNYTSKVVKATQMTQPKGLIQRGVEAIIPSANAAETPAKSPFEGMSDADLLAAYQKAKAPAAKEGGAAFGVYPKGKRDAKNNSNDPLGSVVKGVASGFADVGNTIINSGTNAAANALGGIDDPNGLIDPRLKRPTGMTPLVTGQTMSPAEQENAARARGLQDFNRDNQGGLFTAGRIAGNVAATYPVGGALGAPVRALAPAGSVVNRLGAALASGGANTGAPVAQGLAPAAGNMLLRMAGGAGTGAASAGLIDPNAAGTGAAVGGVLPPALSGVGKVANTAGSLIRPFTAGGQQRIAGDVLREFATDPVAARAALSQAREFVPGSAPTAATASGDAGIAAVTRSMQGADQSFAADMAARQTAQNQARTAVLEGVAGNTGKIDIAERARDAATGPMREQVLEAAGNIPTAPILSRIDRLIADPNNAGQLAQQALKQFRAQIDGLVKDGAINSRALYEVRKDIGSLMQGKLQGEQGNLKYAKGQLNSVQDIIDDAIDRASRRVTAPSGPVAGAPLSSSREVVPFVPSTEVGMPRGNALQARPQGQVGPVLPQAAEEGAGVARPTWRGYLQSYADQSIPIRQMEKLDEILKTVQSNTVDSQGGAILSAAKLNNLLKNKGSDLAKDLSAEQLQILRSIQADLNAGQIAGNVGKAGRSDTFQNFAQNQLLESALGRTLGGSAASTSTLGRMLQLPYGSANKQIQERLGNALLDPKQAAALLADPKNNALLQALTQSQLPYKAAPAISAR